MTRLFFYSDFLTPWQGCRFSWQSRLQANSREKPRGPSRSRMPGRLKAGLLTAPNLQLTARSAAAIRIFLKPRHRHADFQPLKVKV
jgi:hypothetical protein